MVSEGETQKGLERVWPELMLLLGKILSNFRDKQKGPKITHARNPGV